jgi:hypothetical protein
VEVPRAAAQAAAAALLVYAAVSSLSLVFFQLFIDSSFVRTSSRPAVCLIDGSVVWAAGRSAILAQQ